MSERPFLEVVWNDPESSARGYLVIDRLVGGISSGGLRMRAGCTLDEVRELAEAMTVKEAIAFREDHNYRPFGGAKGGIDFSPYDPRARAVLARYLTAMRPLLERCWATGEDLGVQQSTLNEIVSELGLSSSIDAALARLDDPAGGLRRLMDAYAVGVEGISLGDVVGGYGVATAAVTAIERRGGSPHGSTAAIQGFGSIGGAAARYLQRAGVTIVAITDVQGTIANPCGLDVERLLVGRDRSGTIDRGSLADCDATAPGDGWLAAEVDVLVPAAVSHAITIQRCDEIRAPLIVEGANLATTEEARRRLSERGVLIIPDVIANLGTNAWWWWTLFGDVAPDAPEAFAKIAETIGALVTELLDRAATDGSTTSEIARAMAGERVAAG